MPGFPGEADQIATCADAIVLPHKASTVRRPSKEEGTGGRKRATSDLVGDQLLGGNSTASITWMMPLDVWMSV